MNKAVVSNNYAVTAFLTLVFITPFTSGSALHVVFALLWITGFTFYVHVIKRPATHLLLDFRDKSPLLFYGFVVFAVLSIVSYVNVLVSHLPFIHKILASVRYGTYALIVFFTFAIARFVLANQLSHTTIYYCYMLGVVVLAMLLLCMYQWGGAPNAIHWDMEPPVGTHMRMMGIMASVAVMIAALQFMLQKKAAPAQTLVYLLGLCLSFSFLIWTGSRASLLLVCSALLVVSVALVYTSRLAVRKIVIVLCVMLVAIPLAAKVSVFPWNGLQRMTASSQVAGRAGQESSAATAEHLNAVTSGRVTIWKITWREILKSPVLGSGPYGYFFIADRPRLFDHPHNALLQFMLEWGVPAGLLLAGCLIGLLWRGLCGLPRAIEHNDVAFIISKVLLLMLTANAMVDGVYFVSEPLFCLGLAFSCMPVRPIAHSE